MSLSYLKTRNYHSSGSLGTTLLQCLGQRPQEAVVERGGLGKDPPRGLSSRKLMLWRVQWLVTPSSVERSKPHHLWITADCESSALMIDNFLAPRAISLLPVISWKVWGTESSEPWSDRSLSVPSFLPSRESDLLFSGI